MKRMWLFILSVKDELEAHSSRENYNFYMFALFKIGRIYKALTCFADLQGPICYKDAQNKEMNLIVY